MAEGTICGILLYANIVQINSDIYFHSSNSPCKKLAMFLRVFIAWLNLDFGIPTCIYDGMDSYSKAWLQYLFPLYIWFIAGTIIYLSKRNIRIAALFCQSPVHPDSTLVRKTDAFNNANFSIPQSLLVPRRRRRHKPSPPSQNGRQIGKCCTIPASTCRLSLQEV